MKSIYRTVRKCTVCGKDESLDSEKNDNTKNVIIKAEVPAPVLPKSLCSPELLAYIIYEKYCKAVPHERLSKEFTEKGCPLSTQTLSNWVIAAAKIYISNRYMMLCTGSFSENLLSMQTKRLCRYFTKKTVKQRQNPVCGYSVPEKKRNIR